MTPLTPMNDDNSRRWNEKPCPKRDISHADPVHSDRSISDPPHKSNLIKRVGLSQFILLDLCFGVHCRLVPDPKVGCCRYNDRSVVGIGEKVGDLFQWKRAVFALCLDDEDVEINKLDSQPDAVHQVVLPTDLCQCDWIDILVLSMLSTPLCLSQIRGID